MKRTLILLDGFLVLLVTLLAVALFFSVRQQRTENSLLDNQTEMGTNAENSPVSENEEADEQDGLNILVDEVKDGNFTTLTGIWRNKSVSSTAQEILISGSIATIERQQYELIFGGLNAETALPYLNLSIDNSATEKILALYPKGSAIPVIHSDGSVDYSGVHDPTDQTKDRIMLGQSILPVTDTKNQVLYREMEETV
ncbi:hypothetical protein [Lactococcus kimchii]|uniref:hypothetical protein n=1 Tax=Lactococcus sp. S-13 TaxID=2507158 RepID=UPI00102387B1|nr:hypothetical protein [Lactococcus sp. S-13]RZI49043.1 hypothetical protein EQJ87_06065 [Lactococcus sp. S-13]